MHSALPKAAVPEAESITTRQGAVHGASAETAMASSSGPPLTEDLALALLKRSDLPPETLDQLSRNRGLMTSRKVKLALVEHPRTPRHISIPVVRQLFTFDLMQVTLRPVVPADIKIVAEEALISRLERVSAGERLSLARRASGLVAGALLRDPELGVIHAALENSRLTESSVIKALMLRNPSAKFVEAVCRHSRWTPRQEIRIALLRNEKTPLARALDFARSLPAAQLREILHGSRLPARTRSYLLKDLEQRSEPDSPAVDVPSLRERDGSVHPPRSDPRRGREIVWPIIEWGYGRRDASAGQWNLTHVPGTRQAKNGGD